VTGTVTPSIVRRLLAARLLVAAALALAASPTEARQKEGRASVPCGEDCELRVSTHRGLELRNDEPDVRVRLSGRFHMDGARIFDDTTPMDSGWLVRRARPELRVRLFDVLKLRADYEFAPNREGWRNLWIRYAPNDRFWIKAGNIITPFGLEDPASSNHTLFMERGLPSALAPGFQTGAALGFRGKLGDRSSRHRFTFSTMLGTAPFSSGEDDRHRSEHLGVSLRATYAPLARRTRVFHVGGSFEYRNLADDSRWRTRSRPESSIAEAILNTGRLDDVAATLSAAAETVWIHRAFSFQAEYMTTQLKRRGGAQDARLWGAYGQVGWVLTGEHRRYSRSAATVRGPQPDHVLGAVEIGVRVSHLDLTDRDVIGGRATDVTFGVNWYLRQNVRFMFNYVFVDADVRRTLERDRPHVLQGRFAVFF
jgi:phosphate-selective porin OprO/OprP